MSVGSKIKADKTAQKSEFGNLLEEHFAAVPKVGDAITGKILSVANGEVRIDVQGLAAGVIRGRELFNESKEYADVKADDVVEATVLEIENENGEMELSFRIAGHRKAWDNIKALVVSGTPVKGKIYDANKGGLMIQYEALKGFLPVSQLSPEHYPRVPGGDKQKILERLKDYIGKSFSMKVLDVDEREEKIIFSEKSIWEDEQKSLISSFSVGDTIEGVVSALTSFGAFLKFGELEGLIHISELAWQRIDHPRDVIKVGDKVSVKIIQIDGSKIFLSRKALLEDPWKLVAEKYKPGDVVKGKVLKVNPFGLFVELDDEIHGLAHASGLSDEALKDIHEFAKPGDVLDFEVMNIDANEHRLGLQIPGVKNAGEDPVQAKAMAEEVEKGQAVIVETPEPVEVVETPAEVTKSEEVATEVLEQKEDEQKENQVEENQA